MCACRRVSVRTLFGRSVSLVFDPSLRSSSYRTRLEEGEGVNDFYKSQLYGVQYACIFGRWACRTEFAKPSFVLNVLLAVRTLVYLPVDDIRIVYTALYHHVYLLLYVSRQFFRNRIGDPFYRKIRSGNNVTVWKHRLHFYSPHAVYCVWVRLRGSFSKRFKRLFYDETIVKIFKLYIICVFTSSWSPSYNHFNRLFFTYQLVICFCYDVLVTKQY